MEFDRSWKIRLNKKEMNVLQYEVFNMERDGRWWIWPGKLGMEWILTIKCTIKNEGRQWIILGKKEIKVTEWITT